MVHSPLLVRTLATRTPTSLTVTTLTAARFQQHPRYESVRLSDVDRLRVRARRSMLLAQVRQVRGYPAYVELLHKLHMSPSQTV